MLGSLFGKKPKVIKTGQIADKSFASTVNQFGPGFETEFGVDANGNRFQRFNETGDQAALTDARGGIARRLGGVGAALAGSIGQRDDIENDLASGLAGGGAGVEKATFDRALALLAPEQERRERITRNNLVNTGNPIGSERAGYELDRLNRNESTQLNDLALASVLAGQQSQGQQIANLNAYSGGRRANSAADLGQVGNIFSIMQADRPQYFQANQLLSPETVLNRSLGKAGVKQGQNNRNAQLFGSVLDAGARVGSAGFGG